MIVFTNMLYRFQFQWTTKLSIQSHNVLTPLHHSQQLSQSTPIAMHWGSWKGQSTLGPHTDSKQCILETHLATPSMKLMVLLQAIPAFGSFTSGILRATSFDPLWVCPTSLSQEVGIPSFCALKCFKLICTACIKLLRDTLLFAFYM